MMFHRADDSGLSTRQPDDDDPGTRHWPTLEQVQREYMARVLASTGGRIAGPGGAARILGLNPSTLRSRLKKLGLLD